MTFLPISLNITNKKIAIIGGGLCALQKIKVLLKFTNQITVISPQIDSEIENMAVNIIKDIYKIEYIKDAYLVYVCTNNNKVNNEIGNDCEKLGKLCNRADQPKVSDFHSPAIAQTPNFVIGISSKNKEPRKTVRLRDKIETLLDIYESSSEPEQGKVYLVGFGPGNPELMTIKAHKLLFDADVILYDDLIDAQILNKYNGIKEYVGKRRDKHAKEQNEINETLLYYAKQNKMVVRLKGGDPFIFGRGGEEKKYLEAHGISVDVVPGITSAIAAAAYSSIPLTHRGVSASVAFGTAHVKNSYKIMDADTAVYYMGANSIIEIAKKYLAAGYSENFPAAVIFNASMPNQKITITTISSIANGEHEFESPIISIFGKTVNWKDL